MDLRILQVSSATVYGGCEEHIRTLSKYLQREGVRVAVCAPSSGEFARLLRPEGFELLDLSMGRRPGWRSFKSLVRSIAGYRPNIVHTHNRREDLIGALTSKFTGVPVVTTIHDRVNMRQDGTRSRNFQARFYCYILRKWFDKIVTVSNATREDCIAEAHMPTSKIVHIINGMDLERLRASVDRQGDRETKRRELGIPRRAVVFGIVARVRGTDIQKKGHEFFLRAASDTARWKQAAFVIVGEDAAARELLSGMARGLNILDKVIFLGYRQDIINVISCFDVIVLPSLFEGLPRTLMEGMGLGKPGIGTNVDGIAELIENEKNGLLVPPRDVSSLSSAMMRLATHTALRRRMGKAAAETVRRKFDAAIMARNTIELYRQVLSNRKQGWR